MSDFEWIKPKGEEQYEHPGWSYQGWVERYGQEEADRIKARYIHEMLYGRQLSSDEYTEYIASPRWKALAAKTKERVGYRCQVCNSKDRIDVHHRTYENLGVEHIYDVTVLCHDCHELFHKHGKLKR